jgi:tetratricopeptide (TPR) repeat protein
VRVIQPPTHVQLTCVHERRLNNPQSHAAEEDPLTEIDARADLVIHARRIQRKVLADPQRFGQEAADLVVRARRARDPEALVVALHACAWVQRSRLAEAEAKRLLDRAYRIARRAGLRDCAADVLVSRAVVNQELGRLAGAAHDLDAAAGLTAAAGERHTELVFQRAVLAQNIGKLPDAATIYQELLADAQTPLRTTVRAANNLALIEAQRGQYDEALRRLERLVPLAGEVGPAALAPVAQSLAWVTVQSGRLAAGLRRFAEAARAYESARLPLGEHYIDYADTLMDLRLIPEAAAAASLAEDEFRVGGAPLMGAEAALRVAQLALLARDAPAAEAAAREAGGSFGRQGRSVWRARALLVEAEARLESGADCAAELRAVRRAARTLHAAGTPAAAVQAYLVEGRIEASLGRTRPAVDALRRAGDLARRGPVLVRLRGRVAGALAARLLGRDGEVLTHCRRGLFDLARYRSALPSVELRALASGHGAELGQMGLEVVVRAGSPLRVLEWMERTRSAGLLSVAPPDFDDIKDDLDALRAVHAELEALTGQGDRRAATARPLVVEQLAIENRIRRATWQRHATGGYAAGGYAVGTVSTAELRRLLDGRVLVEYGILGDELVAVVLEPRRGRLVPLGRVAAVAEQVRPLLFALRRLAQPRFSGAAPGVSPRDRAWHKRSLALAGARLSAELRVSRLAELLLAPLGAPPDAELVVVPVGNLHGIPWSALHAGPLSLAPSATFWARTRRAVLDRAGRAATDPGWAAAGDAADPGWAATGDAADPGPASRDPVGRVALVAGPNLPGATAEVQALSTVYPQATVVVPPGSTAGTVAELLGGADLAHLACHGKLRADNPMFSALVFSDGPLTLQELQTRGLAPYRMVLASCGSGAEVSVAGDEVLGFVSALLARGTAGIIASIAAIPDVAAVGLMRALHECLVRGGTLAHALHEARATLDRTDPCAYVNWCTFSAHGAG